MSPDMRDVVRDYFAASFNAFFAGSTDGSLHGEIAAAARTISNAFLMDNRLWIAGNGGSAADAQHFAAELVGRFAKPEDKPFPAVALTTDTSFITAWSNDVSFEDIFARQLRAHARKEDVFFAISTSGNSPNIVRALEVAKTMGLVRIGLFGQKGGVAGVLCDVALHVPAVSTPHIQELHIAVIHALCSCIER